MKFSIFKASWLTASLPLPSDLESRWPGGQNVILYRRVRLEEFAPYLRPDGLVKRLTTYQDVDRERRPRGNRKSRSSSNSRPSDFDCVCACVC